jgi:hypothetical protein
MDTTMTTVSASSPATTTRAAIWTVLAAATLTLATSVGSAHAAVDPGPPASPSTHLGSPAQGPAPEWSPQPGSSCPLRRVMTTYVRCDDLTGNGAAAPSWILER